MTTDIDDLEVEVLDVTARHPAARIRRSRSEIIETLTVLGALVGIFASDAQPAGIALADGVYRAGFAALLVWFAARSRRWTWGVLSAVAVVVSLSLLHQVLAVAAVALNAVAVTKNRRSPQLGSIVALLCLPALLNQGPGPLWRLTGGAVDDPFATSALITVLATAPIFRTGWRTISRRRRRTIRKYVKRASLALGSLIAISTLLTALALPSMLRGLEELQFAADSATEGDLADATQRFAIAESEWSRANFIVAGPWTLPARLTPIAGQNIRAAQVVTGQASALAKAAGAVTERTSPDALVVDATVDIEQIDRISPAFDALAATLERAETRIVGISNPWLVPPVAERVNRANEVLAPSAGVIGASAEGLHVARDLLGGREPSNVLVMFTTPAEARGSGGFVGSWALVRGDQGRLEIDRYYRSRELNALLASQGAVLNADADYTNRYQQFSIERHIQDVTISPDFPSVAPVAADLFEQATGIPVDAVISMDPLVIQQLTAFTGRLESNGFSVSGSNAARALLVDQYVAFDDDEALREETLVDLTNQLSDALLENPPDPLAFATELAPLAEQDRINLWLADDPESQTTSRLGLSGRFPAAGDDLLAIVHQNAGQNKIDSFLTRAVDIRTVLHPADREVSHEVTLTLDNSAPSTDLPAAILGSNDQGLESGTNRMLLSVYSRHTVVEARLNGELVPVQPEFEFGLPVYSLVINLAPSEFATLELQIEGELSSDHRYAMSLGAQPLSTADRASWHLRADDGSRVLAPEGWSASADGVRWSGDIDKDRSFAFEVVD